MFPFDSCYQSESFSCLDSLSHNTKFVISLSLRKRSYAKERGEHTLFLSFSFGKWIVFETYETHFLEYQAQV